MTDTDITLSHIIHLGWVKNLSTNTLVFDIAQFFPSLNHYLLTLILEKQVLTYVLLSFSLIILLVEKQTTFGTVSLCLSLMSM